MFNNTIRIHVLHCVISSTVNVTHSKAFVIISVTNTLLPSANRRMELSECLSQNYICALLCNCVCITSWFICRVVSPPFCIYNNVYLSVICRGSSLIVWHRREIKMAQIFILSLFEFIGLAHFH